MDSNYYVQYNELQLLHVQYLIKKNCLSFCKQKYIIYWSINCTECSSDP